MPHLPLELIRMIVEQVATAHQQPLYPLLFVSREFQHEISRVIYRHICIPAAQKRNRLPLSSAAKRSYYASLVEKIEIHSCRLYNGIRRILSACDNLKDLAIFGQDISTIQHILRPDYPFQLASFTCRLTRHPRLTEFLESQSTITTLLWEPSFGSRHSVQDFPAVAPSLPSLQNISSNHLLLSSDLFAKGTIQRIYFPPLTNGSSIPNEATEASRRVTSLRVPGYMVRPGAVLAFFPNVRYLETYWTLDEALDLPLSTFQHLKKVRLCQAEVEQPEQAKIDDLFLQCPQLDVLAVDWYESIDDPEVDLPAESHCSEFRRGDRHVRPDSKNRDTEWMDW